MKKIVILLTVLALLLLSGCQSKPAVNQNAKNGNGTPAVNLPGSGTQTVAAGESGTSNGAGTNNASEAGNESETGNKPEAGDEREVGSGPEASNGLEAGNEAIQAASGDVIEIKEKMFIAQTNDVYLNAEDYLGKTIKYEGIFCAYEVPETGVTYYSVIRYGPGCCGTDANAGFEVRWDKDYPDPDDWVEAIGVLEEYEEDGYQYLRLALTSLTVLTDRGEEYVSQ